MHAIWMGAAEANLNGFTGTCSDHAREQIGAIYALFAKCLPFRAMLTAKFSAG